MLLSHLIHVLEQARELTGDIDVLINIEDVGWIGIDSITVDVLEQVNGNKLDVVVLEPGDENYRDDN